MLKDITKITQTIFDQFINENKLLKAPKALYDTYRALKVAIDYSKLVSEHYLALDFTEEYLQDSSWGEPSDKWREFFNKDLELLNKSIKEYLQTLSYLCLDDGKTSSSFMTELYNCKTSYSFIRDEYNIGFVEPCGFMMISQILDTNFDNEKYHIGKFIKTDLTSYEQRVELQMSLQKKTVILQNSLNDLKTYILKNIRLEELL